jgi:hypothetical protein
MKMGFLYALELDGKVCYIGQTLMPLERRADCLAAKARHHPRPNDKGILAAIRRHGPEKFTVRPLVVANDREYLRELERKAIIAYKTREHGFNIRAGGEGGFERLTEEGRARIGQAARKLWSSPAWSRKFRDDASRRMKARWRDPEARSEILRSLRARQGR